MLVFQTLRVGVILTFRGQIISVSFMANMNTFIVKMKSTKMFIVDNQTIAQVSRRYVSDFYKCNDANVSFTNAAPISSGIRERKI